MSKPRVNRPALGADLNFVGARQSDLLLRVAAQDAEAFGLLYDELSKPLFSLIVRIVGNSADAEDVLVHGFHQVWLVAEAFQPERGSAFAWIVTIMRHRALDVLRSRTCLVRHVAQIAELVFEDRDIATGRELMAGDENRTAVLRALGALSTEDRRAIHLAFFGGLTHQEIARHENRPVGTIKTRIRRGMRKLRSLLMQMHSITLTAG